MIGPAERQAVNLGNWRSRPHSAWAFHNVSELVPVAQVSAGRDLPASGGLGVLAGIEVDPGTGPVALETFLETSGGDSFLVMRGGDILAEWHAAQCDPGKPHILFSVSKSVCGVLAGIAAGEGLLDPEAAVGRYVEVAPGSAYATARVRDLLDMTVGVVFEEDYQKLDGAFGRYRRAMLWNPALPDQPAETVRDVITALPPSGTPHGGPFTYASPNTDLLGLVLEGATGMRYHDYLARRLWLPMGAAGPACITVDRAGTARAAGGFCTTAADLARFGVLMLAGGRNVDGRQLVPEDWVADLRARGSREGWLAGSFPQLFPQGRYRSGWYQVGDGRGSFAADGIHGQRLLCDPVSGIAAVKLSSQDAASDDGATLADFAVLAQVARAF